MRDDFSAKTKEILAKRVAYRCSNPDCRKPTVGPNSEPGKTVLIGVAAHITAAAPGGPRFDFDLAPEERKGIENGIWLCENCAALIDKDEIRFPTHLIEGWKAVAEDEAFKSIQMVTVNHACPNRPYAEAELIWTSGMKRPEGASPKTRTRYGDTPISIVEVIWYNHLGWNYTLKIYNNSSVGLFNLKMHEHRQTAHFTRLDKLPKVNNLPPYRDISLRAETEEMFEGTGGDALKLLEPKFPERIQGLKLLLEYTAEDRKTYFTELTLNGNILDNNHCTGMPDGYS